MYYLYMYMPHGLAHKKAYNTIAGCKKAYTNLEKNRLENASAQIRLGNGDIILEKSGGYGHEWE